MNSEQQADLGLTVRGCATTEDYAREPVRAVATRSQPRLDADADDPLLDSPEAVLLSQNKEPP